MKAWTDYIPHKTCTLNAEYFFQGVCKNCKKKIWYDIATFYGMSDEEATRLLEGKDGGGGGQVVTNFDNVTATSAPTRPIDYD